ncbi:MAG TPA: DUF4058 family protein [Tepidisphaeraceae bacterium]|jgi:hypothetical protein
MPSPFPGVDPFIEASGRWVGFHNILITHCSELLNAELPENYAAVVEGRLKLVDLSNDSLRRQRRPDVAVVSDLDTPNVSGAAAAAVATEINPTMVTLPECEEVPESYIEIISLPDRELVTSIEILSPTNKSKADGGDCLAKRAALLRRGINLVEIDLPLGGDRLPARDPLPPGDFCAFVSRRERRPKAEVYAWSIGRAIPRIPIPLKSPDPDVLLELGAAFKTAYDRGRYDRSLRYDSPLPATLNQADREWAMARAKLAGR